MGRKRRTFTDKFKAKVAIETIRDRFDGSIDRLFAMETSNLRKELLSWKGIGPETADSIILYAVKKPIFVVDAYTKRICSRHGWMKKRSTMTSPNRL